MEIKAVQEMPPIFQAKLLSYMKLRDIPLGLLINFHELRLIDGVRRTILPGAGRRTHGTEHQQTEHQGSKGSEEQ